LFEGSGTDMFFFSNLSKIENEYGFGFTKGKFNNNMNNGGVQQQTNIITIQKVIAINKNAGKHQNTRNKEYKVLLVILWFFFSSKD
jgi:hypothetical protein